MGSRAFLLNHMREALTRSIQTGRSPENFELRLEGLVLRSRLRGAQWGIIGANNEPLASMSYMFHVQGEAMEMIIKKIRTLAGAVKVVHEREERARLMNWDLFRKSVLKEVDRRKKVVETRRLKNGDCEICGRPNGPNRSTRYLWCTVKGFYNCTRWKPKRS